MTIEVVTFGCRLNAYESEAIKARAAEAQLRDTVVVNTCAVTAEAVRHSRQAIRRLKRDNPRSRILVTGCAAQVQPQTYAAMPEVDAVLGNAEKLTAQAYADFGAGTAEPIAEWAKSRGLPIQRIPQRSGRRSPPILDYTTVTQLDARGLLVENSPRLYRFSFADRGAV